MSTNRKVKVAFDVLGTLVSASGGIAHQDIINLYRHFQQLGCYMIIWSGGGQDMAKEMTKELGLTADMICEKDHTIKPDIVFDDDPSMKILGGAFIKV